MHDVFVALAQERNTFQRADVIALGLRDRDLYRALEAEQLHRVRPGTYALYDAWHAATPCQQHLWRARAVVRTAGVEVALTSVTALVALDSPAWGLPLDDVHLLRTDGRSGRREAGTTQHRGKVLPGDLVRVGDDLHASIARACLDLTLTRGMRIEPLVVAIDDLMRRRLVTKTQLHDRFDLSKQAPCALRTDLVLSLCNGDRDSLAESRTAYACWKARLPPPVEQLELVDEHGHTWARLDFAWPKLGVWLEFDGKEKYVMNRRPGESRESAILRAKRAERLREQAIAKATGWRCVRITWADLENPEALTRWLRREVLGAA